MPTSVYEKYVRFSHTDISGDRPLDTITARKIVSNANCLADGSGQVRVASGTQGPDISVTASAGLEYITTFGPFPVTMGVNNTPYKLRVRAGGYVDSHGSGASTFRLVFSTFGDRREVAEAADASTLDLDTTSATMAWLSGDDTVSLPSNRVGDMTTTISTIDSVGGDPATVDWIWCYLTVFCDAAFDGKARIGTMYVAEFVG